MIQLELQFQDVHVNTIQCKCYLTHALAEFDNEGKSQLLLEVMIHRDKDQTASPEDEAYVALETNQRKEHHEGSVTLVSMEGGVIKWVTLKGFNEGHQMMIPGYT